MLAISERDSTHNVEQLGFLVHKQTHAHTHTHTCAAFLGFLSSTSTSSIRPMYRSLLSWACVQPRRMTLCRRSVLTSSGICRQQRVEEEVGGGGAENAIKKLTCLTSRTIQARGKQF